MIRGNRENTPPKPDPAGAFAILKELSVRGVAQADILSLMLCLTKEEKASAFLLFLKENETLSEEALFRKAGEIAFGEASENF